MNRRKNKYIQTRYTDFICTHWFELEFYSPTLDIKITLITLGEQFYINCKNILYQILVATGNVSREHRHTINLSTWATKSHMKNDYIKRCAKYDWKHPFKRHLFFTNSCAFWQCHSGDLDILLFVRKKQEPFHFEQLLSDVLDARKQNVH